MQARGSVSVLEDEDRRATLNPPQRSNRPVVTGGNLIGFRAGRIQDRSAPLATTYPIAA